MEISGHVHDGVVILENAPPLPEGAAVTVTYPAAAQTQTARKKRRIQVPLVHTGQPGTVALTGERIAQIMDDEDAPPRR